MAKQTTPKKTATKNDAVKKSETPKEDLKQGVQLTPEEQKEADGKTANLNQKQENNPSGLTYAQAEEHLDIGELIKLPEWEGFWFKNIKTGQTFVFTKDGEILDTQHEEYKERNDWQVVDSITDDVKQKLSDFHESINQKENKSSDPEPSITDESLSSELKPNVYNHIDEIKTGKKFRIEGKPENYFLFENDRISQYHDNGSLLDTHPVYALQDELIEFID